MTPDTTPPDWESMTPEEEDEAFAEYVSEHEAEWDAGTYVPFVPQG